MHPREIVQSYLDLGLQVVFWPAIDDWKGPREEGWQTRKYTIDDYHDGDRVGIMHGVELRPGAFVIDVDIDWADGAKIARALLPGTKFVWGRTSKEISHCLYLSPDVIPMFQFKDIGDKPATTEMLIEFRSDKHQSMAPPSIWQKEDKREPLSFRAHVEPTMVESAEALKRRCCLASIGMILAKHLGHNGFGHEARLAWAGFLLRVGIAVEDLVLMGEAMSLVCNNREISDVRRVVESTVLALKSEKKKVKGGPALAKILGAKGKLIIAHIQGWLGRDSDFIRNKEGVIVAKSQENIRRAIELLGHEVSYNQFADKMLLDGQPLEDPQWKSLYLEIDREHQFQPPLEFFRMVLEDMAWQNGFHPVKDYIDGLKWDNVKRVDEWLIRAAQAENSDYVRAISAIMLIAAVRRIRQPGCKYDEMVVWESSMQGTDKSSAAQALCPNPLWFSDDLRLNLMSQQLIEATLGKWIIEASDLAGKRKTEIEQLKAMLSRQVDGPARMAYAHFAVERPRHFIIIGTTNSAAYLTDSSGGRRFWPVTVKRFDVQWIKSVRDQLWAEAAVREALGESIRLPEKLWPAATVQQEKRREIDPWEQAIRGYLLGLEETLDGKRRTTTAAVWDMLGIQMHNRDRYGSMRISDIMQRVGFRRTTMRVNKDVIAGYVTDIEGLLDMEAEPISREPGEDDVEPNAPNERKPEEDDTPF